MTDEGDRDRWHDGTRSERAGRPMPIEAAAIPYIIALSYLAMAGVLVWGIFVMGDIIGDLTIDPPSSTLLDGVVVVPGEAAGALLLVPPFALYLANYHMGGSDDGE